MTNYTIISRWFPSKGQVRGQGSSEDMWWVQLLPANYLCLRPTLLMPISALGRSPKGHIHWVLLDHTKKPAKETLRLTWSRSLILRSRSLVQSKRPSQNSTVTQTQRSLLETIPAKWREKRPVLGLTTTHMMETASALRTPKRWRKRWSKKVRIKTRGNNHLNQCHFSRRMPMMSTSASCFGSLPTTRMGST